jgi:hypothetical protein
MVENSDSNDSDGHGYLLCHAVVRDPLALLRQGHPSEPKWPDCTAWHNGLRLVLCDAAPAPLLPAAQLS